MALDKNISCNCTPLASNLNSIISLPSSN
uniref:Uncharacterized protein n=1 Tax=Triticum urartu TaxID=4572 RepID=A0A8R7USC4_TRIUA